MESVNISVSLASSIRWRIGVVGGLITYIAGAMNQATGFIRGCYVLKHEAKQ